MGVFLLTVFLHPVYFFYVQQIVDAAITSNELIEGFPFRETS
jgi:hypothetical protein